MPMDDDEVEAVGPNMWEVAAHHQIPDTHWEYQARKACNDGKGDAAYCGLDYVPVCPHMPVCQPKCDLPLFVWKKKAH
eukprot:CAMPEP_0170142794 /NCGR_PEP_ID=MMETSP0033_2-20121228/8555_1 /TAXON_ID=195969 /ORGANISM="Dolichomastix tenuilepis, Strain CCMP3274" /LENGTH=77 /DNA_ID=CAMNT_0010379169 /DNA_START=10 /DNA_END=243 /DNA_ORIENTATION=+